MDNNDRIWISSDLDGLRMYDPAKDTIIAYRYQKDNSNSIASNIIYDLRPASDGRVYAGTIHGLSIVDTGQDTIINVTESEGLQHYEIQAIVEDDYTNIWLATKGGLSRVNTTDYSVQNYTHSDGLPESEFVTYSSLRDKDGYLYFSTRLHGFRFHPDSLAMDTATAPTYLMDFYLNQKLVSPLDANSILPSHIRFNKRLQLNHRQTDFGFSFTMPIFKEAEQINYFYQLEGYDKEWQLTDAPQVHYTNIDPGDYTFRVKGQNRNGAWSSQEARLEIIVLPPWWRTNWAFVLFSIFGVGTLIWVYHYNLNRQLEQAEARRVKELDTLKTRFFTNITHEFRTPLTIMLGLNERNSNNRDRELIHRNGRKLLTLINQLLDFSKLDTGNLQPHYQQIEIVSFTQYIGESFQSLADKKYIRLMIYSEVEELWLDMDEEKYRQIISNLLSNAIKFTSESGKIIMHLNRQDDQLILKIKDNGTGIPENELPHIFDRFYQVDHSASRVGKGTGIGLALVRKMIELMHGTIHVKSQAGKGTVFEVQFPIRLEAVERLDIFQPVLIGKSAHQVVEWDTGRVATDQPTLLIIEDNPDLVIYMQSLLSTQYQLLLATDGEVGIQQAIDTIPDIIITDVMMPRKDGFAVVETLKQDERSSHIPIIMLTAKATQEDRIRGLKNGADAYLMKPFDKEELLVRLQKLIELRLNLQQKYKTYIPTSEISEDPNERFLQRIKELVHERLSEPDFNVERLTGLLDISHTQFYRKLKALTDQTPSQYIRSIRLKEAQHLLRTTDLNISEIAYKVGFNDPSYFTRLFSKEFGQPPIEFRK